MFKGLLLYQERTPESTEKNSFSRRNFLSRNSRIISFSLTSTLYKKMVRKNKEKRCLSQSLARSLLKSATSTGFPQSDDDNTSTTYRLVHETCHIQHTLLRFVVAVFLLDSLGSLRLTSFNATVGKNSSSFLPVQV